MSLCGGDEILHNYVLKDADSRSASVIPHGLTYSIGLSYTQPPPMIVPLTLSLTMSLASSSAVSGGSRGETCFSRRHSILRGEPDTVTGHNGHGHGTVTTDTVTADTVTVARLQHGHSTVTARSQQTRSQQTRSQQTQSQQTRSQRYRGTARLQQTRSQVTTATVTARSQQTRSQQTRSQHGHARRGHSTVTTDTVTTDTVTAARSQRHGITAGGDIVRLWRRIRHPTNFGKCGGVADGKWVVQILLIGILFADKKRKYGNMPIGKLIAQPCLAHNKTTIG